MPYPHLAEAAAVVGALGATLTLVASGRRLVLAGGGVLGLAGVALAIALVPRDDLGRLGSPLAAAALVVAGLLVAAGAVGFVRKPLVVPVALAVAAPFRVPIKLGGQEAFLLVPLYCVLAAAGIAFVYRLLRGEDPGALPRPLAIAAASFVSLSCVSLLWSRDVENGSVLILFFLLPFAALVAIVARTPIADWLPRALATAIVSLACVFALIGLWQAATQRVFFAPDLEVANAYSTFFRVTSLFRDPSLYGRFLVIAIVVVLTALLLGRVRHAVAFPVVGLLFVGLFFSYSQSSFATLFVMTAAVTFVLADRRARLVVAAACVVLALIATGVVIWSATDVSVRQVTSGRSRLVSITLPLAREHPLAGVGVGAQPLATNERLGLDPETRRTASHTTPATIAAELGALGVLAYLAFLAAGAFTLLEAVRRDRAFGLGLSAVFATIFVHSLVYAGFFEDPLAWGALALAAALVRREPAPAVAGRRQTDWRTVAVRRKVLIGSGLLVLLAAGAALAAYARVNDRAEGHLDTELEGVSVVSPPTETQAPVTTGSEPEAAPPKQGYAYSHSDRLCWPTFGRDGRRAQALPEIPLGKPIKHFWIRGLGGYMEYPPSYCKGMLYVNTVRGTTFAINAHNGAIVWKRWTPGEKPSTPAIAGDRLIVSSKAGTVTAYDRLTGKQLWQVRIRARVESSPIVVRGVVYFGATDGRLFAVDVRNGRVRWAYDTGGRINSSPTILGPRVCITTYAGSIFCLRRSNGAKLWSTYVKRDVVRYESFYASASTDGRRLFTIARSGRVVALNARSGRVLWTRRLPAWGYSTPAVAHGRIFVGDFTGTLRALNAATGRQIWARRVGSRILGPSLVVGRLVFFSTLGTKTYAARIGDGRLVWRVAMGKYSPGIATDRHYFFSLNGILIAYWGQRTTEYGKKGPHLVRTRDVLKTS